MLKFQMYQSWLSRQWRWRLIAANGRIIADSGESYHNKADCLTAIHTIQVQGRDAAIEFKPK